MGASHSVSSLPALSWLLLPFMSGQLPPSQVKAFKVEALKDWRVYPPPPCLGHGWVNERTPCVTLGPFFSPIWQESPLLHLLLLQTIAHLPVSSAKDR